MIETFHSNAVFVWNYRYINMEGEGGVIRRVLINEIKRQVLSLLKDLFILIVWCNIQRRQKDTFYALRLTLKLSAYQTDIIIVAFIWYILFHSQSSAAQPASTNSVLFSYKKKKGRSKVNRKWKSKYFLSPAIRRNYLNCFMAIFAFYLFVVLFEMRSE